MQAQGTRSTIGIQQETTYGVTPGGDAANTPTATASLQKVYFETESIAASRELLTSKSISGTRNPVAPIQGNIDVSGGLTLELQAYLATLFYAAGGSVQTTVTGAGTGEVLGTALTTPTGVIDPLNLTLTITATAHGIVVGDVLFLGTGNTPTVLNSIYCRCIKVVSANVFVVRVPQGITGVATLGAALKKVTTPATTGYTHVIKFGNVLPSYTIEQGFTDIAEYFLYNGMKVNKLALNMAPVGFQKLTLDFSGKKETVGTSAYAAPSDPSGVGKAAFSGFQGTLIEGATDATGTGGNILAVITKCDLSLDNALDTGIYTLGGAGSRGALPEGLVKLSGTLEALFQDSDDGTTFNSLGLYTKATAFTKTSLLLNYTIGSGAGTASNETLSIYIPEVYYKQDSPSVSGPGGVLLNLPWEAHSNSNAVATVMQVTIKSPQLAV